MSERTWGIVSNCWKQQLDAGESLVSLIQRAAQDGYRAIELRQGFLGEFESRLTACSDGGPALTELSGRYPEMQFNLAVSLPLFGGPMDEHDLRFRQALHASLELSAGTSPHLRLVDTATRTPQLDAEAMERAARLLTGMTRTLIHHGGTLSVEHAYQEWSVFAAVLQRSRSQLGNEAHRLRCCFDPCNLLLTEPVEHVIGIVSRIRPDEVSMIHLKQRFLGTILPEVAAGDLDWPQLLAALDRQHHPGPWLFEIAPSDHVWNCLRRSQEYLSFRSHARQSVG